MSSDAFVPAGYLYRNVASKPEWLKAASVVDLYSVSTCSSKAFTDDYFERWKHNELWLFDEPETMTPIAEEAGVDLRACTLFYYEIGVDQFDETTSEWSNAATSSSALPARPSWQLEGYDVVSCAPGSAPGCSPLSCNSLAAKLQVNAHCLFATAAEARAALDAGHFRNVEPGPFRLMSVYSCR